jgi:nucleoside diphosphate kinase
MAEMKSREEQPISGVDYSEICIEDENNLGTGKFTTMLEPKAFTKNNPIISTIENEPVFIMVVSINIAIEEVTAMIGKVHDTPPLSRKVFTIPKDFKTEEANNFTVGFKDWEIKEMILNGDKLQPAE